MRTQNFPTNSDPCRFNTGRRGAKPTTLAGGARGDGGVTGGAVRPSCAEFVPGARIERIGLVQRTTRQAGIPCRNPFGAEAVLTVDESTHFPVLVDEVVDALRLQPGGVYVDATYGRGGHCAAILDHLGREGRLLAFDRDPQAVAAARATFADEARLSVVPAPFSLMGQYLDKEGLTGRVNGIVFDLGVSSPQLEDHDRGFSFQHDGPLDMRMDPVTGISAAQWLDTAAEAEIVSVLFTLGEERYARRIARAIVRERVGQRIETTRQLAQLVARVVPTRERTKHPATRTFLAIRLLVNQELQELQAALPQAVQALAPEGRLVVISFHSLEDRLVKRFVRAQARGDDFPPGVPVRAHELRPQLKLIGKPLRPSGEEVQRNPRARSAILRVAERIGGDRA